MYVDPEQLVYIFRYNMNFIKRENIKKMMYELKSKK